MIVDLNELNIDSLSHPLLSKKDIKHDLENNPFGKCIFYVENNEIIAYLYYSDIYERAEINQIEVKEKHRNCGIGTKLLEHLIKNVKKNITLEVKKDNYPAIKIYKKQGFKECAIRKGYYNGVDAILMERKI